MGHSQPPLCLFSSISHSYINYLLNCNNINWKQHRWCAWDCNPGLNDVRRRRNHGALVAALEILFIGPIHGALQQQEMKAVSAQVVSCCVYDKSKQSKQKLHGTFTYLFGCWANPVVHLLLLKSSMATLTKMIANAKMTYDCRPIWSH